MEKIYMVTFEWSIEDGRDIDIELYSTYSKALEKFNEMINNECNSELSWVGEEAFDENGNLNERFDLNTNTVIDGENELRWHVFDKSDCNRYSLIDLKIKKIK